MAETAPVGTHMDKESQSVIEKAPPDVWEALNLGAHCYHMLHALRQGEMTMRTFILNEHVYFLHSHTSPNRIEIEEIGRVAGMKGRL